MSMHTEKGKETIRLQKLVNNARIEHSTYTVILARLVAYKWEQGSPAFRGLLISILSVRISTAVKSDCDKWTSTVVVMWCTYMSYLQYISPTHMHLINLQRYKDFIIQCSAIISSYDALLQLHGPSAGLRYLRALGLLPPHWSLLFQSLWVFL